MGHGGMNPFHPFQNSSYVTKRRNFHFISYLIASVLRVNRLLAQGNVSDKNLIVVMTHFQSSNMDLICLCCFKKDCGAAWCPV